LDHFSPRHRKTNKGFAVVPYQGAAAPIGQSVTLKPDNQYDLN
jgi:hypothetical protein